MYALSIKLLSGFAVLRTEYSSVLWGLRSRIRWIEVHDG